MTSRALRWALLFVGYPLLAGLAWLWLGIPEATVGQILGSVVLAIAILAGLIVLVALTVADSWRIGRWFGRSGILVLSLVAIAAVCVWLGGSNERFADWLALRVSTLQNTVESPASYRWVLPAILVFAFLLSAAVLLPVVVFRTSRPLRNLRYWGAWTVAALAGVYVPLRLFHWVPAVSGVTAQSVSLGLRLLVAYLLALSCALALCALLRRRALSPPAHPSAAIEAQ